MRGHLLGVFVAQLPKVEADARGDLDGAGHGRRLVGEQARHLGRRLQVPLGVRKQAEAGLGEGAARADAGEHVLERVPLGDVGVGVVGGDERGAGGFGEPGQRGQPVAVVAAIEMVGGEITAPACLGTPQGKLGSEGGARGQGRARGPGVERGRGQEDHDLAAGVGEHVRAPKITRPLGRPPLAQGEKAREPAVGGPVGGEAQQPGAVREVEPGADEQADAGRLGRLVRPDHAGQAVAVGDRGRAVAERSSGGNQLLRMRGAAEEAEVAGDLKLDVAGGGHREVPDIGSPRKSPRCQNLNIC